MYPSPTVSSAELRPRRTWFLVAALIALAGVVAGVLLFVLSLNSATDSMDSVTEGFNESTEQVFQTGDTVSVELAADQRKIVWVDASAVGSGATCDVSGSAVLGTPTTTWTVTNSTGEWRSLYQLSAAGAGTYELTCTAGGGTTPVALAVGQPPQLGEALGFAGRLFGGIGALALLPCLGMVVGGVIALVVALRRGSHRKRLLQQRSAGYGYAPGYGPPR
ncbi:hypothetical protein AB0M79_20585 [Polymorphospora sp. NPDC051019]|uniref:hypothetical protein n=1 Tax=Polymorphospora sp. NPDC051019 TaxID=3155725 RepID=UPI00343FAA31